MNSQVYQSENQIGENTSDDLNRYEEPKKQSKTKKRNMRSLFMHLTQVLGVNLMALAVTYSDVEEILKIISLIVAIAYSIVKLFKEFKS